MGHQATLVINHVTFAHIGQFVCYAHNYINGEKKKVESEPIEVNVKGTPYIREDQEVSDVAAHVRDNINIEIIFCSFPPPSSYWVMNLPNLPDQKVTLLSGARLGRFTADMRWDDSEGHCYVACLNIQDTSVLDSGIYTLEIENEEGGIKTSFRIDVIEDSNEDGNRIIIISGCVLFLFLPSFVVVYLFSKTDLFSISFNTTEL